jgi:hypothetical protein
VAFGTQALDQFARLIKHLPLFVAYVFLQVFFSTCRNLLRKFAAVGSRARTAPAGPFAYGSKSIGGISVLESVSENRFEFCLGSPAKHTDGNIWDVFIGREVGQHPHVREQVVTQRDAKLAADD